MTSKIKHLIELAEKAHDASPIWYEAWEIASGGCLLQDMDSGYIAAASPANLLPILKCAKQLAADLRCLVHGECASLKEWDELNK